MTPPPIRKPTRGKSGHARGGARHRDRNKHINVSRYLAEAIKNHNKEDCPDNERYIDFPYDADSRERNMKALKIVETHLERELDYEENGRKNSLYGQYTFAELAPSYRAAVVSAVTADPDMKVFTQGEANWMIRTLIEQKMASKAKKARSKKPTEQKSAGARKADHVTSLTLGPSTRTPSRRDPYVDDDDEIVPNRTPSSQAREDLAAKMAQRAYENAEALYDEPPVEEAQHSLALPPSPPGNLWIGEKGASINRRRNERNDGIVSSFATPGRPPVVSSSDSHHRREEVTPVLSRFTSREEEAAELRRRLAALEGRDNSRTETPAQYDRAPLAGDSVPALGRIVPTERTKLGHPKSTGGRATRPGMPHGRSKRAARRLSP